MLAAVFYGREKGIEIKDVPAPEIAAGEILVKIMACGLCHTDLHYIEHGTPTFKKPPLILGHEATGVVEKSGSACARFKPGARVLIPSVLPCGTCYNCHSGRGNICNSMQMPGNHIDGAFAQYMKVKEWQLLELPENLDFAEASTIADAVSTAYHAVINRARVTPGQKTLVVGAGGVGINAVQACALAGATVYAVDKDPKKLALAREFGARFTISASDEGNIKRLKNSMDFAFECIGLPETINLAHSCVKAGGTLVIVGYCGQPATIAVNKAMFMEQQIIGSLGCRHSTFNDVIKLASEGKLKLSGLVSGRYPLASIGKAIEALKSGSGIRQVIQPWE